MKCTHCPKWESEMKIIAEVPVSKDSVRRTYACKAGHFTTVTESNDEFNKKYPQVEQGIQKQKEEKAKLNQAFGIKK